MCRSLGRVHFLVQSRITFDSFLPVRRIGFRNQLGSFRLSLDLARVQSVFLAAVEQPNLELRLALLEHACVGDEELRKRVDALLIAHEGTDSSLDWSLVVRVEEMLTQLRADSEFLPETKQNQIDSEPKS